MHLWCVRLSSLEAHIDKLRLNLDKAERRRSEQLSLDIDRYRFIARRGALREILALVTGKAPSDIVFRYTQTGKPELMSDGCPVWHFSTSHSGDVALIALAAGRLVGVDVELLNELDDRLLGDVLPALSEEERAAIEMLPPREALVATYRCWVRKEALLKAIGVGLTIDIKQFAVSVGERHARLLRMDASVGDPARWKIVAVDGPPRVPLGYVAAIVVEGGFLSILEHDWSMATDE